MPWHLRAQPAAFQRQMTPFLRRPGRSATAAVLFLATLALAQGCVAVPTSPIAGPDPANPSVRTPPVAYRSTVAPYVSRRPGEPTPWREQNERVGPPAKPAE
jgi:hypothetical protein